MRLLLPITLLSGHIYSAEKLSGQVLSSLIQSVCLLLTSKNREVVKAALAFVKVLLGAYQPEILSAHLSELVAGLAAMRTDCKNHCRMKTKQIYAKLIKKFGYETVHGMTPESVHKLLTNIRKTQEREKRLKNKKDENASESEDEDEAVPKTRPETIDELLQDSDLEESEETKGKAAKTARQKATQRRAWLKEESEDITDFMDTSGAAKKVLASQPSSKSEKAKGSSKDAGFKVAADGRLIITEPKDDKGEKMDSDQEDDLDDLLTALEGGSDKAGGDIKKKGKPDPYAYVPLDFKQLNKRKQAKLKGQFAGLVKGARKGALKAKKGKVKRTDHSKTGAPARTDHSYAYEQLNGDLSGFLVIGGVLWGAVLVDFSLAGKKNRNQGDWWKSVSRLLVSPCSANPSSLSALQSDILKNAKLSNDQVAKTARDRCLNKSALDVTTKEAGDLTQKLLYNSRAIRWAAKHWDRKVKNLRCNLTTRVKPNRKRKGLNKGEMKAVDDILQIVSYVHYIDMAHPTLKLKGKTKKVGVIMKDLREKLMNIACKLSEALSKSPLDYVEDREVPKDLRQNQKKAARQVMYVIIEKIEEFLRVLPTTYKRRTNKVCNDTNNNNKPGTRQN
nr:hypothetical protein BaRGS_008353 [Batillaria attramentaria]